jgi:hypothetical protein
MTPRRVVWIVVFGAAMGFLEATVVIYLRLLYYPNGFEFPLIRLPLVTVLVELGREAATLVMLWAVAMLAGRTGWERFAWFSILFGIWDLVYYVALKLIVGWPESVFTWDILFLVPVIWVGPVLAPLLISMALLVMGFIVLHHETQRTRVHLVGADRILLTAALLLCLYSFMANHARIHAGGIPEDFPWAPFLLGMALGFGVLAKALLKNPRGRLPRRYGLR